MDKQRNLELTDKEFELAVKRGAARTGPYVTNARYIEERDLISLSFDNGVETLIPRRLLQGLADFSAGDKALSDILILGDGSAIEWPQPDVAFSVKGLLAGAYGSAKWMNEIQQRGGKAKTESKAAAARENGKKGGRPKKAA